MKPIQYSFFKNSKSIKEEAKDDILHSWKDAVLVTTVTKIIPKLIMFFTLVFLGIGLFWMKWYDAWGVRKWKLPYNFWQNFYVGLKWTHTFRIWILLLLIVLVLAYIPLKYGCERYFLLSAKNEDKVEIKEMFAGFKKIFKVWGIEFQRHWLTLIGLVSLYILLRFFDISNLNFLSTIFLVVFAVFFGLGIFRGYKTKMVYRLEVENPVSETDDLFTKSSLLMSKRVVPYIILHLTFVPFHLLAILTLFIWDFKLLALKESSDAFYYLDLL